MKITVENLTQKYGSHTVLDEVSFTTESGKVTALLGPNGSGKSTLIKTIADILPPAGGRTSSFGSGYSKKYLPLFERTGFFLETLSRDPSFAPGKPSASEWLYGAGDD